RIRRIAKLVGASTENLACGQQLNVDFQPDYRLIFRTLVLRKRRRCGHILIVSGFQRKVSRMELAALRRTLAVACFRLDRTENERSADNRRRPAKPGNAADFDEQSFPVPATAHLRGAPLRSTQTNLART